jgi:hypothetical protein
LRRGMLILKIDYFPPAPQAEPHAAGFFSGVFSGLPAPQADPHAAGFFSGFSAPQAEPHAAGFFSGFPDPHAVPQAAPFSGLAFVWFQSAKFESAILSSIKRYMCIRKKLK